MSSIAVRLAPQESFPLVDVSAENAVTVEVMLQNEKLRNVLHQNAEGKSQLYRRAHVTIAKLANRYLNEESSLGIDQGAVLYEATKPLLAPAGVEPSHESIYGELKNLSAITDVDEFLKLISEADAQLGESHPQLRDIILASIERTDRKMGSSAVAAAGILLGMEVRLLKAS